MQRCELAIECCVCNVPFCPYQDDDWKEEDEWDEDDSEYGHHEDGF